MIVSPERNGDMSVRAAFDDRDAHALWELRLHTFFDVESVTN